MLKTKEEIKSFLDEHMINGYSINDDLSVDVNGPVKLNSLKLTALPVQFNKVNGKFSIFANELTTLKGSPRLVIGNFEANNNQLTSLEYSPQSVSGDFYCSFNSIKSLENAPEIVIGNMNVHNNPLTAASLQSLQTDFSGYLSFYEEGNYFDKLPGFEEFYKKEFLTISHKELQTMVLKLKLDNELKIDSSMAKKVKI